MIDTTQITTKLAEWGLTPAQVVTFVLLFALLMVAVALYFSLKADKYEQRKKAAKTEDDLKEWLAVQESQVNDELVKIKSDVDTMKARYAFLKRKLTDIDKLKRALNG